MTNATKPLPPHHRNTVCVKLYGCQLPECRARHNERRRAIAAGMLPPARVLVDATPVRQHILDLQDAGMSLTCIARLAGVAHTTICTFINGRRLTGPTVLASGDEIRMCDRHLVYLSREDANQDHTQTHADEV